MSCLLILILSLLLLLCPSGGAEYCDCFVCPSVCRSVQRHISGTAGLIYTKFYLQIPCVHSSVLLWGHFATLCTSSFMDDVTFGAIGCDAKTWRLHRTATAMSGVATLGWSMMSMNACFE